MTSESQKNKSQIVAVEQFHRTNASQRVVLYRHTNGLFSFREETFVTEEHPSGGEDIEYWSEAYSSGLYETQAEAKADAFRTVSWLSSESST